MASRPPALGELCFLRPLALAFLPGAVKGFPEPRPHPLTAKAETASLAEAWSWGVRGPYSFMGLRRWNTER